MQPGTCTHPGSHKHTHLKGLPSRGREARAASIKALTLSPTSKRMRSDLHPGSMEARPLMMPTGSSAGCMLANTGKHPTSHRVLSLAMWPAGRKLTGVRPLPCLRGRQWVPESSVSPSSEDKVQLTLLTGLTLSPGSTKSNKAKGQNQAKTPGLITAWVTQLKGRQAINGAAMLLHDPPDYGLVPVPQVPFSFLLHFALLSYKFSFCHRLYFLLDL